MGCEISGQVSIDGDMSECTLRDLVQSTLDGVVKLRLSMRLDRNSWQEYISLRDLDDDAGLGRGPKRGGGGMCKKVSTTVTQGAG